MSRYARHIDATHGEVASRFAAWGAEWLDTSRVGGGLGDGLVSFAGRTRIVEVKNPERHTRNGRPRSGGRRQRSTDEKQAKLAARWLDAIVRVETARDVDEVMDSWPIVPERLRAPRHVDTKGGT